jgi:hypothetical protein
MQQTTPKYPSTGPQRELITTLRKERGLAVLTDEQLATLSKSEASAAISALMDMPKPQGPKPSLMDLAAKITGGEPVTGQIAEAVTGGEEDLEADGPIGLAFNRPELSALRAALSIAICETDGTPMDHELHARIDAFLTGAPKAAPKAGGFPVVADGHYALAGPDGVRFYRVQQGKAASKWAGFTFLDSQHSDDYTPVKAATVKRQILEAIAVDPLAAAKLYGTELGVCGVCHKTLTDPKSIADGIGPKCAAKIGG